MAKLNSWLVTVYYGLRSSANQLLLTNYAHEWILNVFPLHPEIFKVRYHYPAQAFLQKARDGLFLYRHAWVN